MFYCEWSDDSRQLSDILDNLIRILRRAAGKRYSLLLAFRNSVYEGHADIRLGSAIRPAKNPVPLLRPLDFRGNRLRHPIHLLGLLDDIAQSLAALIETQRKAMETEELAERIEALEQAQPMRRRT